MLDACLTLRRNEPDVVANYADGEAILVNQSTDVYYRLNRVGSFLWSRIEQGQSVAAIMGALAEGYEVSKERAEADVRSLLDQLLREQLVVSAGPSTAPESPVAPGRPQTYERPRLHIYRMSPHARLQPNVPEIAAKVIDGEAILINVATGVYYSLDGAGANVWSLIEAGCSVRDITDSVAQLYGIPQEQAQEDIQRLIDQMVQEHLVFVPWLSAVREVPRVERTEAPYQAPQLNIYSDMEDLLALDPPLPNVNDVAAPAAQDLHLGNVHWSKPG